MITASAGNEEEKRNERQDAIEKGRRQKERREEKGSEENIHNVNGEHPK